MGSKALLGILLLLLTACGGYEEAPTDPGETSPEQQEGTRAVTVATVGGKTISINYGAPALEGRDMLSQAQTGMVWRLGMNEATTISSEGNLIFGDKELPAGEYTLFARKTGPETWELLVNSQLGQWGSYDRDASKDVAAIPLESTQLENSVEKFTIAVEPISDDSARLAFRWGLLQLSADFRVS